MRRSRPFHVLLLLLIEALAALGDPVLRSVETFLGPQGPHELPQTRPLVRPPARKKNLIHIGNYASGDTWNSWYSLDAPLDPLGPPLDPLGPSRSHVLSYKASEDLSNVVVDPIGHPRHLS